MSKIIFAILGHRLTRRLFIRAAEWLVNQTKNDLDNSLLREIKKEMRWED